MGADIEEIEAAIANFQGDINDLFSETEEAAQDDILAHEVAKPGAAIYGDRENTYFEYASEVMRGPSDYEYVAYRRDVAALVDALDQFTAEAHPSKFDTINEQLKEVHDELQRAIEFNWNDISDALSGWTGGAAGNFRNVVILPFTGRLLRQVNLAKEIATAALSYKAIVVCTRADCLDLAHQLKRKVALSGGSLGLSDLLFVVGAVASGVGLIAGGPIAWPAVISFGASTTSGVLSAIERNEARDYALNGIDAVAGGERDEDRIVHGDAACEFIPSVSDVIETLLDRAGAEEEKIRDGFVADFEALRTGGLPLEFDEPDLASLDSFAGLGLPPDLSINDIVKLKKVGTHDIPAVAEILHQAHAKVSIVSSLLDTGIGEQVYVGTYRWYFHHAAELLDTALTRARDYLYESGQNLATVADDYYATDDDARAALEEQLQQLENPITLEEHIAANDYPPGVTAENIGFDDLYQAEIEDFELDVYTPDPPPLRPGLTY